MSRTQGQGQAPAVRSCRSRDDAIARVARNVPWRALAVHAPQIEMALPVKKTTAGSISRSGTRWRRWAA